MSKFSVVCLLLSIVVFGLISRNADACSCQPAHPQEHYCTSDFVVKALVGKARLVELGPNGEFKRIHKKRIRDKTESSGFPQNIGPAEPEVKTEPEYTVEKVVIPAPIVISEENPAPIYIGAVGPDPRMPGFNPQDLRHSHTKEPAHPPGFNSVEVIYRQRRNALQPLSNEGIMPIYNGPVGQAPGASAGHPKPRAIKMMQYRINIIKTFKGLENITKLQRMFIYTPPAPLCDVKLTTNRSPHILMGRIQDGSMMINACDYKVDMTKLSSKESKNLKLNLIKRFPAGCEQCYVKVCNMGGNCDHSSADEPFQCAWKDWRTTSHPRASQFACLETKKAKCKWYNGYDRKMKPEDLLVR